jgi:hypothetical protein
MHNHPGEECSGMEKMAEQLVNKMRLLSSVILSDNHNTDHGIIVKTSTHRIKLPSF